MNVRDVKVGTRVHATTNTTSGNGEVKGYLMHDACGEPTLSAQVLLDTGEIVYSENLQKPE